MNPGESAARFLPCSFFLRGNRPTRRLHRLVDDVRQHSRPHHDCAKRERTHAGDVFTLTANQIEAEQGDGSDSHSNGSNHAPRNAERAS